MMLTPSRGATAETSRRHPASRGPSTVTSRHAASRGPSVETPHRHPAPSRVLSIAETLIIKLDRQREFSGIFRWAGGIFQFQNGNSRWPCHGRPSRRTIKRSQTSDAVY